MNTGAARKLVADSQDHPSPEDFLAEANAIFNSGTLRGAREVAERGLALYPDDPELQRLHHALRPFESRPKPVSHPPTPDRKDTFDWFRQNAAEYKGQWIAVLGTRLISASPELDEVLQTVHASALNAVPLLYFVD